MNGTIRRMVKDTGMVESDETVYVYIKDTNGRMLATPRISGEGYKIQKK